MKIFISLSLCLFFAIIALSSCKNAKSDEIRDQAKESLGVQAPANQPAGSPALTSAVKHYTCPNNCAGSGGDAQGNCPVCGSAYVHNQAFHDQQNAASPSVTTTPAAPTAPVPAAAPAPAQNASGVYHYTCTKGCAGGAGAAGNCATCGAPLAHNQAYHQ